MESRDDTKVLRKIMITAAVLFVLLVAVRSIQLLMSSRHEVDAMLVLGGTPNRERYAAQLAIQYPHRKILVSGGSQDPCIWLMFNKAQAPKQNVWMERCSHNTLENFMFSTPILNRLGAHKVLLLTDNPQAERAMPMAQAILGAHGMAVELQLVPHSGGEPLHRPIWEDISVGIGWAILSQVYQPDCKPVRLTEVDMNYWYKNGFYCAPQAEVDNYRPAIE